MSAILFGSISTVADTSELQRQSFNQAFAEHGLDWQWNRDDYMDMLQKSGGQQRIADYAQSMGQSVDAAAIHRSKSKIFQQLLRSHSLQPRSGVADIIQQARRDNMKLAFVTTTSQQNVASILNALEGSLPPNSFDVVLDRTKVSANKPSEEAYLFTLEQLGYTPEDCVAIEDNLNGVTAAKRANLPCVAFPNANTQHHDFDAADARVSELAFDQLRQLIASH